MNAYEQKQADRRARLERAAERARLGALAAYNRARSAVAGIEPGQPILVGHHSEKRHRAALARCDASMRRSVELTKLAERLTEQAASVGNGISSDDPDALAKLAEKRSTLEQRREHMKVANAYYRRHGTLDGAPVPDDVLEAGRGTLRVWGAAARAPFPPYALQNIGAQIADVVKRVQAIEAAQGMPASCETIAGVEVEVSPDDNRVLVRFPSRLTREDYNRMRGRGFVWAPSRGAFSRKLSPVAVELARTLAQQIGPTIQEADAA